MDKKVFSIGLSRDKCSSLKWTIVNYRCKKPRSNYQKLNIYAELQHKSFIESGSRPISVKGPYSQLFLFCETYEWTQLARVLHYTGLARLASDKHSSLLGPFLSCKENELLWMWPLFASQHETRGLCYKTNYRGNLPWFDGKTLILCYKSILPW
jgi:hypothetical protein